MQPNRAGRSSGTPGVVIEFLGGGTVAAGAGLVEAQGVGPIIAEVKFPVGIEGKMFARHGGGRGVSGEDVRVKCEKHERKQGRGPRGREFSWALIWPCGQPKAIPFLEPNLWDNMELQLKIKKCKIKKRRGVFLTEFTE